MKEDGSNAVMKTDDNSSNEVRRETHVFLRWCVLFSQLSSTLMMRRPLSSIGRRCSEYCCRRTSDHSRLLWIGTVFALSLIHI